MVEIISGNLKTMEGLRPSQFYRGKKVYSKSGTYLGRIKDIQLSDSKMVGIIVHGKHSLLIDKDYISSDTGEAIMLEIDPVIYLLKKQVFDAEGRKIGKVVGLERKTNANIFSSILVKRFFFSKPFSIQKSDIEVSKKNIILKKAVE